MITLPGSTAARGAWAEDVALAHLTAAGLRLVGRNYRCRHGEIDLVMGDGRDLVMVEVRFRRSGALVDGAQSVDTAKQRRLLAAAEHYLQRHARDIERTCRFDVVSVSGSAARPRVEWITDAFER